MPVCSLCGHEPALDYFKTETSMNEITGNNILFVTSNSLEKYAVEAMLKERGVNLKRIYDSLSSRIKVGILDGYPVVLLCADRGGHKPDSVGVLLPKILPYLRPKLAILAGFSYGRRDSVNLHDVVVSRDVISLVDFKASNQGLNFRSFPQIGSPIQIDDLNDVVNNARPKIVEIVKELGLKLELRVGSMLSGEVMAEGEDFVGPLFANFSDSLSGDMEAQPFAAHCSGQNIPWLAVKSPSDYGGGTGGTINAQAYSAKMSAISSIEIGKNYVKKMKLVCPEDVLSALNAALVEPVKCLVMPGENDILTNSEYASSIAKFVTMLALPQTYDKNFQDHLIGLIKEIAENAAKHERSSEVYLRGSADGVSVEYDGKPFNLIEKFAAMKSVGGGKGELDSFVQSYCGDDALANIEWVYADGKNKVVFKFLKLGADLRRNFVCSMCLDVDEIRQYAYGLDVSFSELAQCDTVWLSTENTFVSLSDWFLLLQLARKIPKTVNYIKVRGCPDRLVAGFRERLQADPRIEFV
jgi:nucleoside phosphorylase